MRLCAFLAIFGIALSAQEPANSPERELHWRQDLQFLSSGLKASGIRIAGGIATKGQKDLAQLYPNFDAEIESIKESIPSLSDGEVVLRLMRLIASAHVVHNQIETPVGMGFLNRLPVNFHWFADGLAVTAATADYASALGTHVVSIGGRTPEQFLSDFAPYISYENDSALHQQGSELMNAAGVLRLFQMVDNDRSVALHLEKPGGETQTVSLPLGQSGPRITVAEGVHLPVPFRGSHPGVYYWHQYLEDSQSLYIQYNVCENDPRQRFSDFARQVLVDADAHTVKRVVLDLRNNGGGNEHVIGPLKDGLAARSRKLGPIYVLIGASTHSSAVENAATLRKELSAKLVGEPSGGMPGGYGEVAMLTLPNSKLVVRYTTKGSRPKEGEPTTLTPDIVAPMKLADYLAGSDPPLDTAIRAR